MPVFATYFLQNLCNTIYPIFCTKPWFVPFSTSEQFIAPKDAEPRPSCLALPFSPQLRRAQPFGQFHVAEKEEKFSIGNPSIGHKKNASAFNENSRSALSQPTRLRVFQEQDRNIAPHCAGRMVISGRMKDVCAEIDRLARAKE